MNLQSPPAGTRRHTQATAVLPRTVTVNAAFLRDIKDDNVQLKRLMDRWKPVLDHPQVLLNHLEELPELMSQLTDQFAFHFSLEEAYGYFEDAVQVDERLCRKASELRNQHSELFEAFRELAEESAQLHLGSDSARDDFRDRASHWLRLFELHEEAELEVILESFDDDLGEGD
ncbi:MAG: hemerythrin domain-containing protein [Planctomycetota bacterium]